MLCNTASYYPDGIDKMIFFQDNDLTKLEIINTYNNLIVQGKYSEANQYINQQEGVYGFFADFFNALENRIYNLQTYLLQKPPKKRYLFYWDADEYNNQTPFSHDDLSEMSHEQLSQYTYGKLSHEKLEEPDLEEGTFWI